MDIEVLLVNQSDTPDIDSGELSGRLAEKGFTLTYITNVDFKSKKIITALDKCADNEVKPSVVILANALSDKGSDSFKRHFSEVVAQAEKAEKPKAPKYYWKKRNKALRNAKKLKLSDERVEEIKESFRLYRKKSKIFNLGDLGNACKGFCFMYKGMQVAVLPRTKYTLSNIEDMLAAAAEKTVEVFKENEEKYPGGFSRVEYIPPKKGLKYRFIPMRGDSGKEIVRKSVALVSLAVFFGALSMLFYNMVYLSYLNKEKMNDIQMIYHNTTEENKTQEGEKKPSEEEKVDWGKLKSINDEIVGWIEVDNTNIDYPVLYHEGDSRSSQYYLYRDYRGNPDDWGSIFVDYRSTKSTKSKNVVMHGHHMNDGTMFADMLKYGTYSIDMNFYKKSPVITFNTPDGDAAYKIISVFKTNTLSGHGEFFNYMIGEFQNEKDFMNYVYNVRIRSMVNCPVDVNEDDSLITLSTCSYEYTDFRTVIVARKVRNGESAKVDVSQASSNNNAVWPQIYYDRNGGTRPKVTDFCTAYDAGQIDWYSGDYDFKEQKIVEATTAPVATDAQGNTIKETQPQTTQPATQAKVYVTVKFVNYDGTKVISEQKVEVGKSAKAPEDPVMPSDDYYDYVFKGWQLDFKEVYSDMIIAPNFEPVLKVKPTETQAEEVAAE